MNRPESGIPRYLEDALENVYVESGLYYQGPSIHGLDALRAAILILVKERDDALNELESLKKNNSHPSVEGLV